MTTINSVRWSFLAALLLLAACGSDGLRGFAQIGASPAKVDFGEVKVGETATKDVVLTNTGSASLVLGGGSAAGALVHAAGWDAAFSASVATLQLAPGASTKLHVAFAPTEVADYGSRLVVVSTAHDDPRLVVALTGKGVTNAVCGDGVVGQGETCDDGVNDGSYGHCGVGCTAVAARCGDGVVNGPENCDDGTNDGRYGTCLPGCQSGLARCGDGLVNGNEECDGSAVSPSVCGGELGPTSSLGCRADCTFDETCCRQHDVEFELTADDRWEGWMDGASIGSGTTFLNWTDARAQHVCSGPHVVAVHAYDTGGTISGFIAVVKVDGQIVSLTGDGSWRQSRASPPDGWMLPGFDDSSWTLPAIVPPDEAAIWGNSDQPLLDEGAKWVWYQNGYTLGEDWFRLKLSLP